MGGEKTAAEILTALERLNFLTCGESGFQQMSTYHNIDPLAISRDILLLLKCNIVVCGYQHNELKTSFQNTRPLWFRAMLSSISEADEKSSFPPKTLLGILAACLHLM